VRSPIMMKLWAALLVNGFSLFGLCGQALRAPRRHAPHGQGRERKGLAGQSAKTWNAARRRRDAR
jgi:hypothetical protein